MTITYAPGAVPAFGDPWTQADFTPVEWAEIQRLLAGWKSAGITREIAAAHVTSDDRPEPWWVYQDPYKFMDTWGYVNRRDAGVPGYTHGTGHYVLGKTFDRIATGAVVVGLTVATAYAGAGAAGLVAAPAAGAEGVTVLSAVESSLPAASEFSLAGGSSGVGIGGQSYGLGLSAEAAGVGLQVPAGAAELLAPALSNPLTYSPAVGFFGSELLATAKTAKDAAQPLLAVGRAARALLAGDAPGGAGPRAVTIAGGDSFLSDALWTVGTLAAVVATLFALSKL